MELRPLNNSSLSVTPIVLGTWPMAGIQWSGVNEKECLRAIARALDLGVNMIDTAYMYGFHGEAERLVGKAIRKRREDVLIATKGGLEWERGGAGRRVDCSYQRLMDHAEESLSRLGVDCIDLYYAHAFDPHTPVAETARAMAELLVQGKIRAVGLSNWTVEQMEEFRQGCELHAVQPLYNMLHREAERDVIPYCREHGIACLVYRPLERGLLTDAIKPGSDFPPEDSRREKPEWRGEEFERTREMVMKLKALAEALGKTTAQIALNWTIHQPGVTAAICGAKRPEQVEENVGAAGWKLSPEDMERVTEIVNSL